jgi:hypothetical protein
MKKLIMLLLAIILITTLGCRASPEPYEQMDPLEIPVQMQVKFKTAAILFRTEDLWVTHQLQLNDEQWLFYAPKSAKVGGNYYMNKEATYFTRDGTEELGYTYERIDVETVRDLLRE